MEMKKKYVWMPYLNLFLMMGIYGWISYMTPRSDFYLFFSQYLLLFGLFYWFWLQTTQWTFKRLLIVAILIRLVAIAAIPELSNDFYRFLWDGELMSRGINPYAYLPDDLISYSQFYHDDYMREVLYHGMGDLSQQHYSCYPVVNQFVFWIPASLFESVGPSVILLKVVLIAADIGSIFFAKKILERLNLSVHKLWLFALNPLIVLEFSGNLHFEGLMIFFLLGAIYLLLSNKWLASSGMLALAVQTKLLPLMLLPFVFKHLRWRRAIGYVAMCGIIVILSGMILLNEEYTGNLLLSVREYFVAFEFNASVFYLLRELGFATVGWDPVHYVGPALSVITAILVLGLAVFRAYRNELDVIKGMMFALLIYHLLATTVHPWYIASILVLSVFTNYKFGLVWSVLVMLSYYAYSNLEFQESPFFLITEYVLLYIILIFEIRWNTKKDTIGTQLKEFFSAPSK